MLRINDVKNLIKLEIHNGNVKDCGYDCLNGRKYVEVRNVIFECDKDCIFDYIPKLPYMEDNWYENNYDPILYKNNQLGKCIWKLIKNPMSRQAVIIMSSTDNLQCTMYMHISLIKYGDAYELEYVVHMRSNDAVEFRTDYEWHRGVYEKIYNELSLAYKLKEKNIIWNVDSLQLYSQYFDEVMKKS